jgi:hypothetical protein
LALVGGHDCHRFDLSLADHAGRWSGAGSGQDQREQGSRISLLGGILVFGAFLCSSLRSFSRSVAHREWFWVVNNSWVMVIALWAIFLALRAPHRPKQLDRSGLK